MADSYLAYQNPTATDKKLDSESLTVGANTVERERIQVAGTTDVGIAAVLNASPTTEYGLVVRDPNAVLIAAAIKGEDAAHSSGDKGVMLLAVREATATDLSVGATDGDYEPLQVSASGRLWVSATIDAALPAGANAIGKLAANSGVIIGAVEIAAAQTLATVTTVSTVTAVSSVNAVVPGFGATNLGKREDDAHTSLDVGVMALAVRSNTAASTSGADGDYQPLITNTTGHLWVDASGQTLTVGSHAVTNAGTFAVQVDGAALTSLQLADDVVYTDDTSTHATGTSKGTGIMAVANPTDAAVDANDIGMVAMTLARALKNDITTIAGTAPTTAGFIDIKGADGNVFVRQATASNLNMTEASAASILTSVQLIDDIVYTDDTSTHATGTSKGALMMAAATPTDAAVNANDIGALAMTLNRELLVQVNTALPAGTNGIGKLTANAGVTIGAVEIAAAQTLATVTTVTTVSSVTAIANIATKDHDGANAAGNNPVMQGYEAIAHGTNPTAVAAGDVTKAYSNRAGIPFVIGGHPNVVTFRVNYTAAQTDTAIVTVAGGLKIVVTRCTVTADNANTVDVAARVGFGTANTPSGTGVLLSHPGIAAGTGVVEGNGSGMLGVGADGEDLRITSEVPTSGSIDVVVSYYTIES